MTSPVRILVAGSAGQVARAVVERGQARGIAVLALGRPEIDLETFETLPQQALDFAPTIVVNAAAYTAVDKAESEEELAYKVNAVGAASLATAAAALDIPIVQISTDYVFNGLSDTPYLETDPTDPAGAYGRTKLAGERLVQKATTKHIILRTAWVTSPFCNNFIKTMLRLGAERDELGVVADQQGSPTSAIDLADAIISIASKIAENGWDDACAGIYHAAGSGETTWHGLAEEIFVASKKFGGPSVPVKPITTAEFPTPAKRPANSRLDCTKLAKVFDVTMPHWQDSTQRCVKRLLAERHSAD